MPEVSVGRGVLVRVGDGVGVRVGVFVGVLVGGMGVGVLVKVGVGVKLLVTVGGRCVDVILGFTWDCVAVVSSSAVAVILAEVCPCSIGVVCELTGDDWVGAIVSLGMTDGSVSTAFWLAVPDTLSVADVATCDPAAILSGIVTVAVASGVLESDKMIANVMANARMPTAAIATITSFPRSRCIYCPSVSNDVSIGKAK